MYLFIWSIERRSTPSRSFSTTCVRSLRPTPPRFCLTLKACTINQSVYVRSCFSEMSVGSVWAEGGSIGCVISWFERNLFCACVFLVSLFVRKLLSREPVGTLNTLRMYRRRPFHAFFSLGFGRYCTSTWSIGIFFLLHCWRFPGSVLPSIAIAEHFRLPACVAAAGRNVRLAFSTT